MIGTRAIAPIVLLLACGGSSDPDVFSSGGNEGLTATTAATTGSSDTSAGDDAILDVFADGEGTADTGPGCGFDDHVPCDGDSDPFHAIGLNCPGELQVQGVQMADPTGVAVLSQWGTAATYTPREGDSFLVLSTGDLGERNDVPVDPGDAGFHCNGWFAGGGMDTTTFPPPISTTPTAGDCLVDGSLVGTGDCSGSIGPQFQQSGFKYDYQEVRFTTTVPADANGLSFDVAFLSKEYPIWFGRPYNDMFVAWLESSTWSGNISFDQTGAPLSLNAAFLEYFDDAGTLPEFEGTCMRYSAGTGWLNTTIEVIPGDTITLVFAIFDLDDANWDSFVFLDNFQWNCEGGGGPTTNPVD